MTSKPQRQVVRQPMKPIKVLDSSLFCAIILLMAKIKTSLNSKVKTPEFFRPILWSYDFNNINPQKDKKTIIVNAINYGNLNHWRWLVQYYGKNEIKKILSKIPVTEIRPRVLKLTSIIFNIKNFNYASRGIRR